MQWACQARWLRIWPSFGFTMNAQALRGAGCDTPWRESSSLPALPDAPFGGRQARQARRTCEYAKCPRGLRASPASRDGRASARTLTYPAHAVKCATRHRPARSFRYGACPRQGRLFTSLLSRQARVLSPAIVNAEVQNSGAILPLSWRQANHNVNASSTTMCCPSKPPVPSRSRLGAGQASYFFRTIVNTPNTPHPCP